MPDHSPIDTDQKLKSVLTRYRSSIYQKPIAAHTLQSFQVAREKIVQYRDNLILDSGCGVAESSLYLAISNPTQLVIGAEKSAFKLSKLSSYLKNFGLTELPENLLIIRSDLIDLWRLLQKDSFTLQRHCILYPTPWPKKNHLQRRWYAHPVLPTLLALKGELEIRSNLLWYLEGWQYALNFFGINTIAIGKIKSEPPMTPFERKYQARGEQPYQLKVNLGVSPQIII